VAVAPASRTPCTFAGIHIIPLQTLRAGDYIRLQSGGVRADISGQTKVLTLANNMS
jgi:hypothetical protein